ncbi:AB hydrolase superfamily protein [Venturia nashicola]|uniref:AB hydrolase superfamily protein n=1 Tax=Venturia nashicola TaxID=86259 RepID=A0A4Z1NXS5_9PEZI|nr:AB hydrolase superfamily protein [Venturia nashicola]
MASQPSHSFLTYLRLKVFATITRLFLRLIAPIPTPHPSQLLTLRSRSNHEIKANIYNSKSFPPTPGKPHPVLLNWHGSGFMMPLHGQDEYFCKLIAEKTDYTVFDLNYRLAPENPFPAGLEDARDAIAYVLARPEIYDQSRITLSGFSAGGALLLGACGLPSPHAEDGKSIGNLVEKIVAVYPPADLSKKPGSKRAPEGGQGTIPPFLAKLFNDAYLPPGVNRQDPRASPTYIDVEKMPESILFITCGKDNLAWEAEKMITKIRDSRDEGNGDVSFHRVDGVHHGWDKAPKTGSDDEKKRDEAYSLIVDFLNRKS